MNAHFAKGIEHFVIDVCDLKVLQEISEELFDELLVAFDEPRTFFNYSDASFFKLKGARWDLDYQIQNIVNVFHIILIDFDILIIIDSKLTRLLYLMTDMMPNKFASMTVHACQFSLIEP